MAIKHSMLQRINSCAPQQTLRATPHPAFNRRLCLHCVASDTEAQTTKRSPVHLPYAQSFSESNDECYTSIVACNNQAHPMYTELSVEVRDTPGLLRIISWVLNGMGVRVVHGVCRTVQEETDEGILQVAKDRFWLSDLRGRKLSDAAAQGVAQRLQDFVVYCGIRNVNQTQEWRVGPYEVSNVAHPQYTQLIIYGEPSHSKPGYLLELASVMSSVGAMVHEAVIQGGPDCPHDHCPVAGPTYDFSQGRYFRFWMTDLSGAKMDDSRVSAILFTLRLLGGDGYMPTVAPNAENLIVKGL